MNELIVNNKKYITSQDIEHEFVEAIAIGLLEFKDSNSVDEYRTIQVPCAVVKDGANIIRVINNKGLFNAFGRNSHGRRAVEGLPSAVTAKGIAKYIPKEEWPLLQEIRYKCGKKVYSGYNAEALIVIVKAYLKAEEKNELLEKQKPQLRQAKAILINLAGQRIRDLVDRATGYVNETQISALEKLVEKMYLNDIPLTTIARRFSGEFYKEVYRIHGWNFNANSSKRPQYVGAFTKKYVYSLLPDCVMKEIESRNPIVKEKDYHYRKNKYYHFLTVDTGIKELDDVIKMLIKVMKISTDKRDFIKKYNIAFEEELRDKNIKPLQKLVLSGIELVAD